MSNAAPVNHSFLTNSSNPVVTIAIPTYNRASFLKDCLLSALSQSYPHFEVLVADNASTDETQEMLAQFTDQRLRILKQKRNIGALPNWNSCLAEARGRYVVFVSDDDRILPHMLNRMMSVIEHQPEIPVVLALCDVRDLEHGTTWHTPKSKQFKTGILRGTDLLREHLNGNIFVVMCSILLRTDVLRAQGGFRTDMYAADMAAWAHILLKGDAGFVNELCAVFSCHKGSLTYRLPIDQHIEDERRMIHTIRVSAELDIHEPKERIKTTLSARRYLARSICGIIIAYAERGVGFFDVLLPLAWRFRSELRYIGTLHAIRLVRPVGKVILSGRMIQQLRWFTRAYRSIYKL